MVSGLRMRSVFGGLCDFAKPGHSQHLVPAIKIIVVQKAVGHIRVPDHLDVIRLRFAGSSSHRRNCRVLPPQFIADRVVCHPAFRSPV